MALFPSFLYFLLSSPPVAFFPSFLYFLLSSHSSGFLFLLHHIRLFLSIFILSRLVYSPFSPFSPSSYLFLHLFPRFIRLFFSFLLSLPFLPLPHTHFFPSPPNGYLIFSPLPCPSGSFPLFPSLPFFLLLFLSVRSSYPSDFFPFFSPTPQPFLTRYYPPFSRYCADWFSVPLLQTYKYWGDMLFQPPQLRPLISRDRMHEICMLWFRSVAFSNA